MANILAHLCERNAVGRRKVYRPEFRERAAVPLAVRRLACRFSLSIAVAGIMAEAAGLHVGADR